jgi:hypothetical protein
LKRFFFLSFFLCVFACGLYVVRLCVLKGYRPSFSESQQMSSSSFPCVYACMMAGTWAVRQSVNSLASRHFLFWLFSPSPFWLSPTLQPCRTVGSLTDTQHKVLDNSLNEPWSLLMLHNPFELPSKELYMSPEPWCRASLTGLNRLV